MKQNLIIATKNRWKIEEINYLLKNQSFNLSYLDPNLDPAEENGVCYLSNAESKALHYSKLSQYKNEIVLSEDSGLHVKNLIGWIEEETCLLPGIYSSRFHELSLEYGRTGKLMIKGIRRNYLPQRDADGFNNRRLLEIIKFWERGYRGAIYTSAVAVACDGFLLWSRQEICEGSIVKEQTGIHGFGNDFIFAPDKLPDKKFNFQRITFGEMPLAEKCKISHRSKVFSIFTEWFEKNSQLQLSLKSTTTR